MRRLPEFRSLVLAATFAVGAFLPLARCQNGDDLVAFDPHATMQSIAALLVEDHISHHPVDDAVSERAFATLFDDLDPQRLFFLQADLDALRTERDRLDDYLRAGDDGFALQLQDLFDQRLQDASELALRWLAVKPDFGIDESISIDGKSTGFATSAAALDDRWRRRVKLDRLAVEADGASGDQIVQRLRRRYTNMAHRRDNEQLAVSRFLEAIASSYDPHTTYFSPSAAEDFAMLTRLHYEGIGAVLGEDDGRVIVKKLIHGGSARASGEIAAGDVIRAIGPDDDSALEPIDGWPLGDIVDRIRGPHGTFVRLSLSTAGKPPRTVRLERRQTELADHYAKGEVLNEEGERVGWIELPGFYADAESGRTATRDVARLLAGFVEQGVTGVVLDLRANGGGLLSEAVSLTGLFLDAGNVVRVQDSDGNIRRYDDPDHRVAWSGPLLVLTSRLSASASEILAGAIQDNGRGLVVGDTTTHGKGTVQTVIDLADCPVHRGDRPSGTLKVTIQQFFRPGGDSTQLHGVHADIVLPAWTEALTEGEAASDNALPFRAIAPLVHGRTAARGTALVQRLAQASAHRIADDAAFRSVVKANAVREQLQAQKQIPLTRPAYAAWRAATRVERIDDDATKEPAYYRSEVCRIAHDYAEALRHPVVPA
jgi:carboxyl-terminal processing protease